MKTIYQTPAKIVIGVAILTITFILICISTNGYGQQARCEDHFKPGIALGSYCSGNGHGTYYDVAMSLRVHRSTIMVGPSLQKASGNLNAAKLWYSYSLTAVEPSCRKGRTGEWTDPTTELCFFTSVQYYKGAILSKAVRELEANMDKSTDDVLRKMKLNTVELSGGIGIHFRINDKVHVRTYVGVAYYQHLNLHEQLFHDKQGAVMIAGLGIGLGN